MGLMGISVPQLLIILMIVIMIFGTKRFRQAGSDLGAMFGGFRKELKDVDTKDIVSDVNKARKSVNTVKKIIGKK